jgi:hypothetical protein
MSSPAVGPKLEPAKPDSGVSRKPLEDFLGRTVAVATIVGFIAQGFGAGLHTTAIVFVLTFVAAYPIHRYQLLSRLQGRLKSAPISPLMVIAVALACILGGMLLRQHYMISPAGVDVGELTDGFNWKLRWCRQDVLCKAAAISSLPEEVAPKDKRPGEQLFSDQVLGEILRSSPESMSILRKYYGVDKEFLGTGLSKPLGQENFFSARIPEYLVPNYPDTHQGVLVWKLDPILKYADQNLYDTLLTTTPDNATGWSKQQLKDMRANLNKRLAWNATAPAVVRFALIPRGGYSGCLGRVEAHEVFASHFGLMKANAVTVEDATRMSGYPLTTEADEELYAFVFVPAHDDELKQPTWTHMAGNLRAEMDRPSPCLEATGAGAGAGAGH